MSNNFFKGYLILFTLISSEFILWLPLAKTLSTMKRMMHGSKKLLLYKRISDEKKEKLLPVYAIRLFFSSIALLLQLVIIIIPILLGTRFLTSSFTSAMEIISTLPNLLLITVFSIGYITLRIKWLNARLFSN